MSVDVQTEIEIRRPRAEVAAFAADPLNAPSWYVNIKRAEWLTDTELALGKQVAFTAHFLGRTLAYTYSIKEHRRQPPCHGHRRWTVRDGNHL